MTARIVMLGGPGAGKGTQARRLAKRHGWAHISTGDIFRSHLEMNTELGQQIEEHMRSGRLVPDELAVQIVVQRLREPDCQPGYILDGFPRSVPQAEALTKMLNERGEALNAAIMLDVSDQEIVDRLTARRICPNCGKIYNMKFNPPKQDEICDKPQCEGAQLMHREDDYEATVRERLRIYHETTEPVIQYYEQAGLLERVDGDTNENDVTSQIEEVVMAQGAS